MALLETLAERLLVGEVTLQHLATELQLAPRTLQTRLEQHSETYREVLDRVRYRQAELNEADTSGFAGSTDHTPSGQMNLVGSASGGNSPAWHGAAPGAATDGAEGQNNAAALSGVKSKEFGGQGYNQLVFDDTPNQGRMQLHSTQARPGCRWATCCTRRITTGAASGAWGSNCAPMPGAACAPCVGSCSAPTA